MGKLVKMGLTGGIASGKSEVGRLLAEKGFPVFDMDKIGKSLLDLDPIIKKEIVSVFGESATTNKEIDRSKLRNLVFSDSQNRKTLEQIVQPRIRKEFEKRVEQEELKGTPLIVCEAALLIESGYRHKLDKLTVVMAPEETRLKRLLLRDPISADLAQGVFEAQVKDKERLALADYLLENTGSLSSLNREVEALIAQWKTDGLI